MFSIILPFKDGSSQLRLNIHENQLFIISRLATEDIRGILDRADFKEFARTLFESAFPSTDESVARISSLLCLILKKVGFGGPDILKWPSSIDFLWLIAKYSPSDIGAAFDVARKNCRNFARKLGDISARSATVRLDPRLLFLLKSLAKLDSSIACPSNEALVDEIVAFFPDLSIDEIERRVDAFDGERDLIVQDLAAHNQMLLDSDTRSRLHAATLKAAERFMDEDDDDYGDEAEQEDASKSDIPSEWRSHRQVPQKFHPLVQLYASEPSILSRERRKDARRVGLEKSTGMSAEQIEGWASMLTRNPHWRQIVQQFQEAERWKVSSHGKDR